MKSGQPLMPIIIIIMYADYFYIGLNNGISLLLIILIPSTVFPTILLILFIVTLCVIKRTCLAKKTLDDHNKEPTYEEITQSHKAIPMEENAAYGHIITYTK